MAGGEDETRAIRASLFASAAELTPLLGVDAEGSRYFFSSRDRGPGRSLFLTAGRRDVELLGRTLRILAFLYGAELEGTFVDVGANIGTTTIAALCDYGFTFAVACEPEPENLSLLRLNLVANKVERSVVVCPAAIGNSEGMCDFVAHPEHSGLHEVVTRGGVTPYMESAGRPISVPQTTVDALARNRTMDPSKVGLLWMDVEGHEGHVLSGATCLSERGVPAVMELDPVALARHGGLEPIQRAANEYYTHFVSLRRIRAKRELGFDLEPVATLGGEFEDLRESQRFTDLLLVREPKATPTHAGVSRLQRAQRTAERRQERTPPPEHGRDQPALRPPDEVTPRERRDFVKQVRPFGAFVAAVIGGATFIVRTARNSPELPVFVRRTDVRLSALEAAVSALDDLGLGPAARGKTFFDLGAGAGVGTVAAICWHQFSRGIAYEPEPDACDVLRLNLAANNLSDRVCLLPGGATSRGDMLDALLRDEAPSEDPGLVWIDERVDPAQAARLLADGAPVVLHLGQGSRAVAELIGAGGLVETHTHFAIVPRIRAADELQPVTSLPRIARRTTQRATYVLAVRVSHTQRRGLENADRPGPR